MSDEIDDAAAAELARAHNRATWKLTWRFWIPLYLLYAGSLFAVLFFSGAIR